MLDQKELVKLEKGEAVNHFLLVRKYELRVTKAGKQYLFLELGDKSVTLNANVWDNFETAAKNISAGSVVKVSGSIDEFQGSLQIKVNSIRKLKPSEEVLPVDFLPVSSRDVEMMKKEFYDRIERLSDIHLKSLIKRIFIQDRFDRFILAPAGKSWHHSYIHGLLEHTLEIIKICDLISDIHPELNSDLLISGAMLHDFGKTEELSFDSSFEYTDKGKLIGHIVISAMLVNEEIKNISGFPPELKDCLLHLILSHQGKLEHASPVIPKTLEAIALYHADELSAKVNAYKIAISANAGSENKWTKFITLAATDLYNHGILPEDREDIPKDNSGMKRTLFD